jgi:hypothetical protein
MSAQVVSLYLNYTVSNYYPWLLFQYTVLPANLTEGTDWYNNCTSDCFQSNNDSNYVVLAAWLPANSTGGALTQADF